MQAFLWTVSLTVNSPAALQVGILVVVIVLFCFGLPYKRLHDSGIKKP